MKVLHVFSEPDRSVWKAHMRAFFGVIPDDNDDYNPKDQSYVGCYCGGRIMRLGDDENRETVCAIWHNLVQLEGDSEE